MLTSRRSLSLNAESGRELPRVDALDVLYRKGCKPRHGEVVMVAGRSGSQKSGFALWYAAMMNLPTLYFSGDMSAFTASSRLACTVSGNPTEEVEAGLAVGGPLRQQYLDSLRDLNITFSFGSPITYRQIEEELTAYVELWDAYPEVMVFDNLMDFEGAEADYTAQMQAMSEITELARHTGATCIVLHHASDKTWSAAQNPWRPPARNEIKNGMAEKPELCLTVALDPHSMDFNIAVVKQRMGPSDPTAESYVTITCQADRTRFVSHKTNVIYRPGGA